MAEQKTETELKRLGFVRVVAIQALVCVSSLYDYAKQSSGPLRSTVEKVETAVVTVAGSLYEKLNPLPLHLLLVLDNQVDKAANKFDKDAPPLAKQVVGRAHGLMLTVVDKADNFINKARSSGPRSAINYIAHESKQLAINQAANLWVFLNRNPSVHWVGEKATPLIVHGSNKYNNVLKGFKVKGFVLIKYLPLIPVDEISKAIKQSEAEKKQESPVSPPQNKSPSSPQNKSPSSTENESTASPEHESTASPEHESDSD